MTFSTSPTVMMRSMRLQSELDPLCPLASCLSDDLSAPVATHCCCSDRGLAAGVIVEVDRGSASSRGRHLDRAFMIRLRQGDHSVIVTIGLSQRAAEGLAGHIADVIGGALSIESEP